MILQYLYMSVESMKQRKVRSWLTMVGIFIGITALIAIVSLGQGLEVAITEQFNELGNDKLWIQPGTSAFSAGSSAANLTERDRRIADRTAGVVDSVGMSYKNTKIEYKDEEAFVLVMGHTSRDGEELWQEMFGDNIIEGRWQDPGDTFKAVAGFDYTQDKKVFNRRLKLFDTLTINGQNIKIIGFQEKIGNSVDDQTIHVTDQGYERIFEESIEDDYKTIVAQTAPGDDPRQVADRLEKRLRNDRGLDEGDEDFTIQTTEEFMDSFNNILQIVQVVIAGIAAISLLVGGIGIMNTMYTSVLERTKEIGIMKAIGARNSDILMLFLIESGLLGIIGGGIGVIFGLVIAKTIEYLGAVALGTNLLYAWWSWELIVFALAFAFFVGTLSGILPARQASKQSAVDSLRYE